MLMTPIAFGFDVLVLISSSKFSVLIVFFSRLAHVHSSYTLLWEHGQRHCLFYFKLVGVLHN